MTVKCLSPGKTVPIWKDNQDDMGRYREPDLDCISEGFSGIGGAVEYSINALLNQELETTMGKSEPRLSEWVLLSWPEKKTWEGSFSDTQLTSEDLLP